MSNTDLTTLEEKSESISLKEIFDAMEYDSSEPEFENITAIFNWLNLHRKGTLKTTVSGEPFESEGVDLNLAFSKSNIKVTLLDSEESVISACKLSLGKGASNEGRKLCCQERQKRLKEFQNLLLSQKPHLIQLVAYATQIPSQIISRSFKASWLPPVEYMTAQLEAVLKSGSVHVGDSPKRESFDLKYFLPLFQAAILTDQPLIMFLSPHENDLRLIVPLIFVVDVLNKTKIRTTPIDILLMSSKVEESSLMKKLTEEGVKKILKLSSSINLTKELDSVSTSLECTIGEPLNSQATMGESVNYVIDTTCDLASAINSITRNFLYSGVNINHRCRSLLFVQQAMYGQVVADMKTILDKLVIKPYSSEVPSACDFVERNLRQTKVLNCVKSLGAKTIATKDDFCVPTVVYDIGTSADLVAMKEPGLGHVIVMIPYRNLSELCAINNNFAAEELYLFTNAISATMNMLRQLDCREMFVNGVKVESVTKHTSNGSWVIVTDVGKPSLLGKESSSVIDLSKIFSATVSPEWLKMSTFQRILSLDQIRHILLPLHSSAPLVGHLGDVNKNGVHVRQILSKRISCLIITDASKISPYNFVTSVIACVLREKPVVVVVLHSEVHKTIIDCINAWLPANLVSIVNVSSFQSIEQYAKDCELIWVLQDKERFIPLDWISKMSDCKMLLVNSMDEINVFDNAGIAIDSAFVNCHM